MLRHAQANANGNAALADWAMLHLPSCTSEAKLAKRATAITLWPRCRLSEGFQHACFCYLHTHSFETGRRTHSCAACFHARCVLPFGLQGLACWGCLQHWLSWAGLVAPSSSCSAYGSGEGAPYAAKQYATTSLTQPNALLAPQPLSLASWKPQYTYTRQGVLLPSQQGLWTDLQTTPLHVWFLKSQLAYLQAASAHA